MRANGAIEGGASGFSVGDSVYVMKKYDNSVVKVIGHTDGVHACGYKYIIFQYSVTMGGGGFKGYVVVVWDMDTSAPAVIPGITFPCSYQDAAFVNWLASKETTDGESFITAAFSDLDYGNTYFDNIGRGSFANDYPPGDQIDSSVLTVIWSNEGSQVTKEDVSIYALKTQTEELSVRTNWESRASKLLKEDGSQSDVYIGYRAQLEMEVITPFGETPPEYVRKYTMIDSCLVDCFDNKIVEWPYFWDLGDHETATYSEYMYHCYRSVDYLGDAANNYAAKLLAKKTDRESIILEYHLFHPFIDRYGYGRGDRKFAVSARAMRRTGNIEDVDMIAAGRDAALSALIESAFNYLYALSGVPDGVFSGFQSITFAR